MIASVHRHRLGQQTWCRTYRELDSNEHAKALFGKTRYSRRWCGDRNRPGTISACIRKLGFAALCIMIALCASNSASAADADFPRFTRAVEFCRSDVVRPMALSENRDVLCFDGEIWPGQDYVAAASLEQGGLFVVRSMGGDGWTAGAPVASLADGAAVRLTCRSWSGSR